MKNHTTNNRPEADLNLSFEMIEEIKKEIDALIAEESEKDKPS